jgi:hypothetical protein
MRNGCFALVLRDLPDAAKIFFRRRAYAPSQSADLDYGHPELPGFFAKRFRDVTLASRNAIPN